MIIEFMLDRKRSNDEALTNAILGLSCAVDKLREQAHAEHETKQILHRIEKKVENLMASQAESAAELRTANAQLRKLVTDSAGTQPAFDALNAKIVELEALIASGSATQQELVDAIAETKTLAQAVDDNIPELPVTPPTP